MYFSHLPKHIFFALASRTVTGNFQDISPNVQYSALARYIRKITKTNKINESQSKASKTKQKHTSSKQENNAKKN